MNKTYPFWKMLRRMIQNAAKHDKALFAWFAAFTLMESIYPFFAVVLPKFLIQEMTSVSEAHISNIIFITGIFFAMSALFGFGKTFAKENSYARLTALRIDYIGAEFSKLINIDYKYMEDAKFYEDNNMALNAVSGNDNGVEAVYHKLFETPAVIITTLAFSVIIGLMNPLVLLGILINAAVTLLIGRCKHNYRYSKKDEIGRCNRRREYYVKTSSDFRYGKDIRLYSLKPRILSNYMNEIKEFIKVEGKIANREYALSFLGLAALLLSDGLTYGILVYKTVNGMSLANFSMYLGMAITLSGLIISVTQNCSFMWNEGQYVHDFYEFMDADYGEKGGALPAIKNDSLEIEFRNASFKYPGTDKYIFKNLNFTIHKGERLAIVGINGAGKSTLVKLMTGLFSLTDGELLINNIPIAQFSKQALYSMFSVVFQDVNTYAFTIAENVACRSKDIDEARVWECLDRVGLKGKIEGYEEGINQIMLKYIDENGVEFSGGEKQKLSIARALYEDGNMVIMDEPTAALDALAEADIYENFSALVKGKTAVYISHRLASTKFCDKIALFDENGLVEYGSHDELMALNGNYHNMFVVQGKYYQEGELQNAE